MSDDRDDLPGGVIELSRDLRIVRMNRAMADIAGRPSTEVIGASFDSLLAGPSRILFQTHVHPALRSGGRVEEVFLTLTSPDGDVPIVFNAEATPGSDGFTALAVRVMARVTWEKDLLEAMRLIAAEREASGRLASELAEAAADVAERQARERRTREFRDAFLGIVSHELRTPITTIFGLSHILARQAARMPRGELRDYLFDIHAEADRLRELTDDLLVLGRLEGDRLDVEIEPIAVGHVIASVVRTERRRSPSHAFVDSVGRTLPPGLGSPSLVEQILRNYFGNAVKYSPPGTTIRISAAEHDDGITIAVRDEGPGIGSESPDQLFEPFYRGADARHVKAGSGIGLFVCRELAKAMGARVWARGRPDPEPGAEFGLWIPRAAEDDA